ncbi:MAG: hypothetical protein ACJ8LN_16900, partial [Sulfurifustis sp.]
MRHDDLPRKALWEPIPAQPEISPAGEHTRSPPRVDVVAHPAESGFLPWYTAAPFVAAHAAVLGAFWTGVGWRDVLCCFLLYAVRMFGVTAGYHRYFSHRSYKANR